jgi:hypothetical protein
MRTPTHGERRYVRLRLRFVFPPDRGADVDFDRDIFRERAGDVFDEARALRFIAPLAAPLRAPVLALFCFALVLFRRAIAPAVRPGVRRAAAVVLVAARCAVSAATRAVLVVDCAALSAVLPMFCGDVMPVSSAARSVS